MEDQTAEQFSMDERKEILDLSTTLIDEVATRFKNFLNTECQRIAPNLVYICHFSPDNDYGVPEGKYVVKTFALSKTKSPPQKPTMTATELRVVTPPAPSLRVSKLYESEKYYFLLFHGCELIPRLKAYAENKDINCLVMKYYPGGDLVAKIKDIELTWSEALKILIRIADIFNMIHTRFSSEKLVYQDVKPENFLLDGDNVIICDLASICTEGFLDVIESTPYLDEGPQAGRFAYQEGDIFKLGKLILAFVTTISIQNPNTGVMVKNIKQEVLRTLEETVDKFMRPKMLSSGCRDMDARAIIDLVLTCLDSNLENRPSAGFLAKRLRDIKQGDTV